MYICSIRVIRVPFLNLWVNGILASGKTKISNPKNQIPSVRVIFKTFQNSCSQKNTFALKIVSRTHNRKPITHNSQPKTDNSQPKTTNIPLQTQPPSSLQLLLFPVHSLSGKSTTLYHHQPQ